MRKKIYTIEEAQMLIGRGPSVVWHILIKFNIPYSTVNGRVVIRQDQYEYIQKMLGFKFYEDEITHISEVEINGVEETKERVKESILNTEMEEAYTESSEEQGDKRGTNKKNSRRAGNK